MSATPYHSILGFLGAINLMTELHAEETLYIEFAVVSSCCRV
jgi:hypothetical protein